MHLSLLFRELPALDAKARFVLQAFIRCYGATVSPGDRAARAKDLQLSSNDLERMLGRLAEVGLLVRMPIATGRSGQPLHAFVASEHLVEILRAGAARSVAHGDLIDHLLCSSEIHAIKPGEMPKSPKSRVVLVNDKTVPVRLSHLSVSNRYLLAVLLGHADSFGVVDGLGATALARLAGVDHAGLAQRLGRLVQLGFIRMQIPGIASPIFASKLTSKYLLNLNHPQLSNGEEQTKILLYWGPDDRENDFRLLAGVMFDRDSYRAGLKNRTPLSVTQLFEAAPRQAITQLEFFICGCATSLIRRNQSSFDQCSLGEKLGSDEFLRGQIRQFFREPMVRSKTGSILDRLQVENFLSELVVALAHECMSRFPVTQPRLIGNLYFMLYPVDLGRAHRCLALLVKKRPTETRFQHEVTTTQERSPATIAYELEIKIPNDMLRESRLLSTG